LFFHGFLYKSMDACTSSELKRFYS